MPQKILPFFPEGVVELSANLALKKEGNQVVYFNGVMPVFTHEERDVRSFQMIIAQFCINGNVKQAEVSRALGVPKISLKRWVKKYRESGIEGFYAPRKTRGAGVLIPEVLEKAQNGLDEGKSLREISEELGVKKDTLRKAVKTGKLKKK